MITNWGYEITNLDELPGLLSVTEFNEFTAGRYSGDARITPNINAVSAAIRNYCGWHVYPPVDCKVDMSALDRRIVRVGADLLIQLPAKFVTEVLSVTIAGEDHDDFVLETNGILRLFGVKPINRRAHICVAYTAGCSDEMMGSVKELAAYRVTHAAASSNGITTEAAGGVSVTYNAAWVSGSSSTSLPDEGKEALAPYRVQGVF